MSTDRNIDPARLLIELHRKSSAFASFRQAAARRINNLSDALEKCRNQLLQAQMEILSLKEQMLKRLPQKQPEILLDLRAEANMSTFMQNNPIITENANLKHQIALLQSENLRLQQELNRLNGGPSPFQYLTNKIGIGKSEIVGIGSGGTVIN